MSSQNSNAKLPATELGALLRHWRDLRGKSQFDLSLDAGVSQRHISFIESGRSVPSRPTLLGVAQALDIPLRDRNALPLAASAMRAGSMFGRRMGRSRDAERDRRSETHAAPATSPSRP